MLQCHRPGPSIHKIHQTVELAQSQKQQIDRTTLQCVLSLSRLRNWPIRLLSRLSCLRSFWIVRRLSNQFVSNYSINPIFRNVLVSGAMSVQDQIKELKNGCDIITCTPGRVRDLLQQELILMSHVRFFVLDEADSLVSGQSDSMRVIRELHSKIPRYSFDGQRLQMVVCSATLHNFDVSKLAVILWLFKTFICTVLRTSLCTFHNGLI